MENHGYTFGNAKAAMAKGLQMTEVLDAVAAAGCVKSSASQSPISQLPVGAMSG